MNMIADLPKTFDATSATTALDKRRADVRRRHADIIDDIRTSDPDWTAAGRYRRDDTQVEALASDIADGRKPKLPGEDKAAEKYLLKDALAAADGRLTRMITDARIDAAAGHRELTADDYRAMQRERALLIARLRRLNGVANRYLGSLKGAGPALHCERIKSGVLLGTADDKFPPAREFLLAAVRDGLITEKEIENA